MKRFYYDYQNFHGCPEDPNCIYWIFEGYDYICCSKECIHLDPEENLNKESIDDSQKLKCKNESQDTYKSQIDISALKTKT